MPGRGTILVLMVIGQCLASGAGAVELPQEIKTDDGFAVRLPAGWVPIPKNVLQEYAARAQAAAPKAAPPANDYGFQRDGDAPWFTSPYLIIQVQRSGRLSERKLLGLEKEFRKGITRSGEDLKGLLSAVEAGQTVYDPNTHILWKTLAMDVEKAGRVKALVGMRLTEEGAIHIMGYADARDFNRYAPTIEAVIKGVVLDDALVYKTPPGRSSTWLRYLRGGAAGTIATVAAAVAVVAGILAAILAARKKKAAVAGSAAPERTGKKRGRGGRK